MCVPPSPLGPCARPLTTNLLSAQGHHENRIYELKMVCGDSYPREPPVIYFVSQINLPGVNQTNGQVDKNAVGILRDWQTIYNELSKTHTDGKTDPLSLEASLIAIRK
jgi:ubiquitin-conjugating enzyme E2 variant